jgi:hypothetical protein
MRLKRDFAVVPICLVLFTGIFIFPSRFVFSQSDSLLNTVEAVLGVAQNAYGPDDLLVNGSLYIPGHPRAEESPYFRDERWTHGRIVIGGKTFDKTEFIYNAEIDRVIIQSRDRKQNKIAVLLNQDFVDAFYIDEHEFINLNQLSLAKSETGFAELIYRSGLNFVIRHKKEFLNQYSQSNPFGSYSKLQSMKCIQAGDKLLKLPTKRSFLDYFKPYRIQIKKYFRENNIRYRNASKNELQGLLKLCDELSAGK